MLAARYVNNDPNYLWEREKDYELHVKKIERILSETRKPKKNPVLELAEKLENCKKENKKMLEGERQLLINKNNQILLEKLVEIGRGKESVVRDYKIQARSSPHLPKTLNSNYMRVEAERIAIENESMAKRIIQQKPTIKNTELKREVDKYLELRLHMQKYKDYYAEPPKKIKKKKKKKLPPLISNNESEGRHSSTSNPLTNKLAATTKSNPVTNRTEDQISKQNASNNENSSINIIENSKATKSANEQFDKRAAEDKNQVEKQAEIPVGRTNQAEVGKTNKDGVGKANQEEEGKANQEDDGDI